MIKPVYSTAPSDTRKVRRIDPETGEITEKRVPVRNVDPDAKIHVVGDGRQVHGNKFWHAAVRGEENHQRVILAVAHVPDEKGAKNSEADVAVPRLIDLVDRATGTEGVITDGVLHGIHRSRFIRATGRRVISPIAAASIDRASGRRVEKEGYLRTEFFLASDGSVEDVEIYFVGGRLAQLVITDAGVRHLEPLRRVDNERRPNDDGTWRDYVVYELADPFGGPPRRLRERTWNNADDDARGFNRAENIHQIPPGDPDYERLYHRRSDAESINRRIDDFLYLRRAGSLGAKRQLLDLFCHGFVINALTKHRHRKQNSLPQAEAA